MSRPQLDVVALRLVKVLAAFVDLLPKNVCMWDAPNMPGYRIGSSAAAWSLLHRTFHCATWSA